jgi:hypothetical protein
MNNATRLATNKLNVVKAQLSKTQKLAQLPSLSPLSQPPTLTIAIAIIFNLTANVKHHLAIQAFTRQR